MQIKRGQNRASRAARGGAIAVSVGALAVGLLAAPVQGADNHRGSKQRNVGNAEINYLDDEYCFDTGGWDVCRFDQEGDGTVVRVVPDGSPAADRDGSLRLFTPRRGDQLAMNSSASAATPLSDLSGKTLSFSVQVRRGRAPSFWMGVDCAPEKNGGGQSMHYAGPLPGPGDGWGRVDLVQRGEALWTVSTSEEPQTFDAIRADCPKGRVGGYGFDLGYGEPSAGSDVRVDDVRVGEDRTNFWVTLTRIRAAIGARESRQLLELRRSSSLALTEFARTDAHTGEDPTRRRRPIARGAVIAPQGDSPTTLIAAPLARSVRGPLLVLPGESLGGDTVRTLGVVAKKAPVFLVGNRRQLSAKLERQLRREGRRVVRLAGPTKFATAVKVARAIDRRRPDGVRRQLVLASIKQPPQTFSAAAAAGARQGAVLLTNGRRLPPVTKRYLARHRPAGVFAVGQQAAAAVDLPHWREITGPHRYATAVQVANRLFPRPRSAVFASGALSVDALLAGAYGGYKHGPLLLVHKHQVPPGVRRYLRRHRAQMSGSLLVAENQAVSPATYRRLARLLSKT